MYLSLSSSSNELYRYCSESFKRKSKRCDAVSSFVQKEMFLVCPSCVKLLKIRLYLSVEIDICGISNVNKYICD